MVIFTKHDNLWSKSKKLPIYYIWFVSSQILTLHLNSFVLVCTEICRQSIIWISGGVFQNKTGIITSFSVFHISAMQEFHSNTHKNILTCNSFYIQKKCFSFVKCRYLSKVPYLPLSSSCSLKSIKIDEYSD